jgi:REP element-mobilizing transposase RayT
VLVPLPFEFRQTHTLLIESFNFIFLLSSITALSMGRKYSFRDNRQLYFVTFTVVHWVDVFIREDYRKILYESIKYCQTNKGLEVYAYCIMTSHVHLIIGTENGSLSDIVRDFKSYHYCPTKNTSRHMIPLEKFIKK